jgi:hypothetical protein
MYFSSCYARKTNHDENEEDGITYLPFPAQEYFSKRNCSCDQLNQYYPTVPESTGSGLARRRA